MRDYAKVIPKFWTGKTGKEIRKQGPEAVVVAMYLMTSPHSNMLGLYFQPTMYMAYETGLGMEGASKGLRSCIEAGFCSFDEASEMVWVHEMAAYQIADELKSTDKRSAGVQKDYDALQDNPFLGAFFDRYATAFHLKNRRGMEAPSKPLRSQEQEQEQEQEQDKGPNGPVGGTDQPGGEQKQQGENSPPLGDNAEGEETAEEGAAADAGLPRCSIEAVVELYHQHLQELPRVRLLNDKRRRAIRKVWRWVLTSKKSDGSARATTAEEAVAWLTGYFRRASQNDFLMGRGHRSAEHAGWQCDLDFLLTDKGMQHVIEKTKGGAA